ncbi:YrzQ family protein [Bacillus pinisoli]|nr:YrzQ family protein [Bacillus pinisoli]
MNRTLTSLIAAGIGAYAFHKAQENDMMSSRPVRKLRRRISKMW